MRAVGPKAVADKAAELVALEEDATSRTELGEIVVERIGRHSAAAVGRSVHIPATRCAFQCVDAGQPNAV
jgi:hypothetical protein